MTRVNRGLVTVVVGLLAAGCGGSGGGGTPDPIVPPPGSTYTISGAVSGVVSSGVTLTLGGAQSTTTTAGAGGAYSFTGLANGSYTVTPSHAGHVFAPTSAPVVVAGGNQVAVNFVASSPAGTWMTKASMPTARSGLASAVVGGNIYAVGGLNYAINTTNGWLATVEAYNPANDGWVARAAMPTARFDLAAAAVNGIVYAAGGDNVATCSSCNGFKMLTTVEAYTVATNSWATKAPMLTARERFAAVEVSGKVYAVGGLVPDTSVNPVWVKPTATVEVYDPVANTWTAKASMPTARSSLRAAVVNGLIYAIGGDGVSANGLLTVEAYNPATNAWATRASLPAGNPISSADAVNGLIYAIRDSGEVDVYDPAANTWVVRASMNKSFYATDRTTAVVGATIYTLGGRDSFGALSDVEAITP
jgi:N-acetylneuraminic acid mutarotase